MGTTSVVSIQCCNDCRFHQFSFSFKPYRHEVQVDRSVLSWSATKQQQERQQGQLSANKDTSSSHHGPTTTARSKFSLACFVVKIIISSSLGEDPLLTCTIMIIERLCVKKQGKQVKLSKEETKTNIIRL